MPIDVYLEVGSRRTFVGGIAWPGWCRSGRTEEAALETLAVYAPRYAAVAGRAFKAPEDAGALRVVERLAGDATTDFGAPGASPSADAAPLGRAELDRLLGLLRASWSAFEAAARAAKGKTLRTGPRGGGRTVAAMQAHVFEADHAYYRELGGKERFTDAEALREAIAALASSRAAGAEPEPGPRRRKPFWTPRYLVRRAAWHALDHAWEIEDRMP